MIHGNNVRWEQGVNRVVQADLDSDAVSGGGAPVEIVIRVNCCFNDTENTQLALMLPRENVEGGKRDEDLVRRKRD